MLQDRFNRIKNFLKRNVFLCVLNILTVVFHKQLSWKTLPSKVMLARNLLFEIPSVSGDHPAFAWKQDPSPLFSPGLKSAPS